MTFEDIFKGIPGASEFVTEMPKIWPFSLWQDVYAPFGALHLVGLALMGGAVILLNLRLMGAGIKEEPLPQLEKTLRPWLITGLAIVLGTGIIIGVLNSDKLYKSVPFFIKMVSLVAACIYSFGVSNVVAKNDGKTTTGVLVAAGIAFILWLVALGVLGSDTISAPGLFHPLSAGYALLIIYGVRTRWFAVGSFALLFGGMFVMYWIVGFNTYDEMYDTISRMLTIIGAIVFAALFGYEVYAGRAEPASPTAKLIALFSVLTWVTVAAGGRWIGFAS